MSPEDQKALKALFVQALKASAKELLEANLKKTQRYSISRVTRSFTT